MNDDDETILAELSPAKRRRPEIGSAIAYAFIAAIALAVVSSPGGDPYWTAYAWVVLFPSFLSVYWLGYRQGRRESE